MTGVQANSDLIFWRHPLPKVMLRGEGGVANFILANTGVGRQNGLQDVTYFLKGMSNSFMVSICSLINFDLW